MEVELMSGIKGNIPFNALMDRMEIAQDRNLKEQKRIKIGKKNEKYVRSAAWIDDNIRLNQKLRQILNKKWRKARQNKKPRRELESLEKDYKVQQKKTSILMGQTKGAWEKARIQEGKITNGKSMWTVIQEVLGKRKSRKEQIYIYIDEKERKPVEEIWDPYIEDWKSTVYQKQERVLKQNWYGNKENKGLKAEIIEEEKMLGERSRMMKMPQMTADDLIRIVGKQKNGKAAGTDCIKAEVLKHLVKNNKFVEITVRAINRIPYGKIHRRMKESRTTMLKKMPETRHKGLETNSSRKHNGQDNLWILQGKNRGTPKRQQPQARNTIWFYKGRKGGTLYFYYQPYNKHDLRK